MASRIDSPLLAAAEGPDRFGYTGLHRLIRARRERDDATRWDPVLDYLDAIPDDERRSAVVVLKQGKLQETPLHLACRSRPPLNVIQTILNICPETAKIANRNGILPIHYGCIHHAPSSVIGLLLRHGTTEILHVADRKYGRLPIHYACLHRVSDDVFDLLIEGGGPAALLQADTYNGRIPLHYACLHKIAPDVIRRLLDVGGEKSLSATDRSGRVPLHYAYYGVGGSSPAGMASREVFGLLIDKGMELLPVSDTRGRGNGTTEQKRQQCFGHDKGPPEGQHPLWDDNVRDFFCLLQDQERALVHPHVREFLNEAFVHRPVCAILMMDLYVQIGLIAEFSFFSARFVDGMIDARIGNWHYRALYLAVAWLATREVFQMATTRYRMWISDVWNLMDVAQIGLVSASVVVMIQGEPVSDSGRVLLMVTAGLVWLMLLKVLKNFFYGIAVFVVAMEQILITIVPFFITTSIIIAAFVQMYYVGNTNSAHCNESDVTNSCNDNSWFCATKGLIGLLYGKLYAMLLAGVDVQMFEGNAIATGLSYAFGGIIGLFFLNVLIAEISNIFTRVEERGREAFWRNRFSVLTEVYFILNLSCVPTFPRFKEVFSWISFADDWDQDQILEFVYGEWEDVSTTAVEWMWEVLQISLYRCTIPLVLLLWFVFGLISFGLLLPKWMKEWLFFGDVNTDAGRDKTVASLQKEIATVRGKLEELPRLQAEIASLQAKLDTLLTRLP